MSLRLRLLTAAMRRLEKPYLARVQSPAVLRRNFERNARLFFRPARHCRFRDDRLGEVPARWVAPRGGADDAVLLHFHGGGYVFGSSRTHGGLVSHLAALAGVPACLPDYRLAPEHPFPAAPEDALACFRALLSRGIAPGRIVIGGDSAGGGLALALLALAEAAGLPAPAGAYAMSPLCDMTFSGASFRDNAGSEAMLPARRAGTLAKLYLHGASPRDPRASPLFARFRAPPPVWLAVGAREILRDDSRRMARRLRDSGGRVALLEDPEAPHVWPLYPGPLPEARAARRALASWISRRLASSADS